MNLTTQKDWSVKPCIEFDGKKAFLGSPNEKLTIPKIIVNLIKMDYFAKAKKSLFSGVFVKMNQDNGRIS